MQKVLAIDDEPENLNMVEYTLCDEYEVIAVNSGEMALKCLKQIQPELILLDIRMPRMDGLETMEKIKQLPDCEMIPVIFLTSSQDVETEVTCFEMGAVDYIRKPFEPKIMKQRIKRTLRLFQLKQSEVQPMTSEAEQESRENYVVQIQVNGIAVPVPEKEIQYVEVYNNNCVVKTKKQELKTRATLERLQDMLHMDFIRTGRSYLVNPAFVDRIEDDYVFMQDGMDIKLPRRNKKELIAAILSRSLT